MTKEDHAQRKLGVLLELYFNLRSEILKSIELQYRSLSLGGIAISLVLGIGLGQSVYRIFLIALPPVSLIIVSTWLIEQSRMMRAGNFNQFIENEINKLEGEPVVYWETWLRYKGRHFTEDEILSLEPSQKGLLSRPENIHYIAQYLSLLLFLASGVLVSVYMILKPEDLVMIEPISKISKLEINHTLNLAILIRVFGIIFLILLIFLLEPVIFVVKHRGRGAEYHHLRNFLKRYSSFLRKREEVTKRRHQLSGRSGGILSDEEVR